MGAWRRGGGGRAEGEGGEAEGGGEEVTQEVGEEGVGEGVLRPVACGGGQEVDGTRSRRAR